MQPCHRLWSFIVMLSSLSACQQRAPSQALGTLERDRVLLKSTAAELITALPMAQGSSVKEGDLVVQLDTQRQNAQLAKASANVASAQALLAKLQHGARKEDIAATRSQLEGARALALDAQKAFERSAILVRQKLAGQAQLDSNRAQRDTAQAGVARVNENLLLLTNGSRLEDLQQAEAALALSQASLTLEQQALADLSVRTTRAGRLDLLPKHLGERVTTGETLAVILAGIAPYARVYIPESARAGIRAGQTLLVKVDGVTENQQGIVRWVSQDPAFTPYFALNSADRSRLVYVAEIQLPDSAAQLPSGVPVQVDLTP